MREKRGSTFIEFLVTIIPIVSITVAIRYIGADEVIFTSPLNVAGWHCTAAKYPSKELNEKFAPYCIQYTKTEGN